MTRTLRCLFAALMFSYAPAALAQPMGPPHGGHGPGEIGRYMALVQRAGLSDSQQQQVHALLENGRSSARALHESLRSEQQALDAKIYAQSTPSADDLTAETTRLAQLHAQLEAADLQTVSKIRALLTPDQLVRVNGLHDKLDSLHQQMDEILGPPETGAPAMMP